MFSLSLERKNPDSKLWYVSYPWYSILILVIVLTKTAKHPKDITVLDIVYFTGPIEELEFHNSLYFANSFQERVPQTRAGY